MQLNPDKETASLLVHCTKRTICSPALAAARLSACASVANRVQVSWTAALRRAQSALLLSPEGDAPQSMLRPYEVPAA